jgi:outer membrane receptor protein involved in Fe transport
MTALFQASDALQFRGSYMTQKTETDGHAQANSGVYEQSLLEVAPWHVERGQKLGLFDENIHLANGIVEYDLGSLNLLATYSHLSSGSTEITSYGTFAGPLPMSYRSHGDSRGDIGEIRLTTELAGAWNFLGGLYAEDLDDGAIFHRDWYGSPEKNIYTPGEIRIPLSLYDTRRGLTQKAAFGEVSWKPLPGATLTAGARVYNYVRTELTNTTGPVYGESHPPFLRANRSGESFRGNLSYKLGDNALVYGGWSQGFRLGRAQTGLAASCDPDGDGTADGTDIVIASTKIVNSDNVNNYELGSKFTLLNGRMMMAASGYRIDWVDVPVVVNIVAFGGLGLDRGCYPVYTANAGSGRSHGLELQTNLYVTRSFRVDAGGSYTRARLTKDVPALNAPVGTRLPGSPEVTANLGLQYDFNIGGNPTFRADGVYVGTFKNALSQVSPASAGGYLKIDASARTTIRNANIELFVRNLTNADEFTFGGADPRNPFAGFRLRPRTIGLQVSHDF